MKGHSQKAILRGLEKADLDQAALIYERAFSEPWGKAALLDLLKMKGAYGFCITDQQDKQQLHGFVLATVLFEMAEILTIAVDPAQQGASFGKILMQAAEAHAQSVGAEKMLLEVAEDNEKARHVYARLGYEEISRRKNYYKREGGKYVDAFNMKKDLG